MRKFHYYLAIILMLIISPFSGNKSYADNVPLRKINDSATDVPPNVLSRTRVYIPLTVSFENGELALFFETNVGMCNVSIEDADGNVQMTEIIDTDSDTEFWFDVTGLSAGLHYLKISYGSMNLVGEFYVE